MMKLKWQRENNRVDTRLCYSHTFSLLSSFTPFIRIVFLYINKLPSSHTDINIQNIQENPHSIFVVVKSVFWEKDNTYVVNLCSKILIEIVLKTIFICYFVSDYWLIFFLIKSGITVLQTIICIYNYFSLYFW